MGIKLIVEVLEHRPATLGDKETVTLLAIAESARDNTRVAMPGHDVLRQRCKCTQRTLSRRIEALEKAGVIEIVSRSQPGRRATYKIVQLPLMVDTYLSTILDAGEPVDNSGTVDTYLSTITAEDDQRMVDKNETNGRHLPVHHSQIMVDTLHGHPPLKLPNTLTPPSPQLPNGSAVNSPVENHAPESGQTTISASTPPRRLDSAAYATWQAGQSRKHRQETA